MSERGGNTWTAFSMCNLATSIANKDFSKQDTAIANKPGDMPDYFSESLETLKNLDFSTVDYITISYGTNDYAAGVPLDNSQNQHDQTTFAGALRYSIETLLNAYPNLRILIGSPTWRCWLNEDKSQILETSDDKIFNDYTLPTMVDKCIEIGKIYHIPVLNAYDNLSLNKFNWSSFFNKNSTDAVHPNAYGRSCLGKEYAYALCNM